MLSLLTPSRIEIVKPSTRLRNRSGTGRPDSLNLLLRAYTALDNPGCLIVGSLRVELFPFRPASGQNKGNRIATWNIELTTRDQQQRHWNPVLQMYELNLGLDIDAIPPAEKYVLQVTYNSPLGKHLTDETVFTLLAGPGEIDITATPGRSAGPGGG